MFRRRRQSGEQPASEPASGDAAVVEEDGAAGENALEPAPGATDAAGAGDAGATSDTGPWDAGTAPTDVTRVDLGALQVPVTTDLEVQLNAVDDEVVAATVVYQGSAVQMQAFSAPKSGDIWREVRRELADSIRSSGGSVEEIEGSFGTELAAHVPMETSGAGVQTQPLRFIGVDGPRWFLQCVFSGDAAAGAERFGQLHEVVRGTVVVRGDAPLPPRELLELRFPPDVQQDGMDQQV